MMFVFREDPVGHKQGLGVIIGSVRIDRIIGEPGWPRNSPLHRTYPQLLTPGLLRLTLQGPGYIGLLWFFWYAGHKNFSHEGGKLSTRHRLRGR
jgi:hypothetical protein